MTLPTNAVDVVDVADIVADVDVVGIVAVAIVANLSSSGRQTARSLMTGGSLRSSAK